jgi:imidazolonepropionase-like amidohydrolase
MALAVAAVAGAQTNNPAGPPVSKSDYALTNVRIVTAPGKVIERGTVVFVDGRITAVGANVTIPAGVVRMDLAGHTVFPGLIDAATSVGLPNPMRPLPTTADATAAPAGGRVGSRRGCARCRPATRDVLVDRPRLQSCFLRSRRMPRRPTCFNPLRQSSRRCARVV